jgi:phage head maturation protease
MRWNHFGPVVGKFTEIKEDEVGLYVEGELTPDHSVAKDVYASLKHGAIDGMSIGYRVKDDEMEDNIRVLKEIELIEISVVEEPADLGAVVGDVKHINELIEQIDSPKDAERFMREACGFSRAQATSLVSRIKRLGERGHEAPKSVSAMLKQKWG